MAEFLKKVPGSFLTCVALLLSLGCQSFFYYPLKGKLFDPVKLNMEPPEDVFLKTAKGDTIHGWYFRATTLLESKGTLLFFHGNAENVTSHFLMFHWLPAKGYNFFIFDYPGFGRSSGNPTPESTVDAGMAAVEWLHLEKDPRPLIIYGHSLGGIVALKVVEEVKNKVPVGVVVVEASFSSYKKIAGSILGSRWWTWPFQPFTRFVINDDYAPESVSAISPIPLLFIHGSEDHTVDIENTQKMFAEAKEPKQIWIIPGGRHGDLFEVQKGILRKQFLSYLSKTFTAPPSR